jgi:hypothetical protein
MKKMIAVAAGLLALTLAADPARADHDKGRGKGHAYGHSKTRGTWELFGNAERVKVGKGDFAYALTSDLLADAPYGGVAFTPKGELTFADITRLSADYRLLDGAAGGSPRFQVTVRNEDGEEGNVFIYLGTEPNFDDGPGDWESTGNLIGSTDLRFDTTQVGGQFYDDYEGALELVGGLEVVEVALVVDGGWFPGFEDGQTVLVDNVRVNSTVLSGKGKSK